MTDTCDISNGGTGQINTSDLKTLLDSNIPFILIDAREAPWDDGKRIPGAISISSTLSIEALLPHKDALIVVYCSHQKCGASGRLMNRLSTLGYQFLIKYPDGIEGWINQGHATV